MGNFKLYFFIFLFITLSRITFNYNLTTLPKKIPINNINKKLINNSITNELFFYIKNYFFIDETGKFYRPKYNLTVNEINEAKNFLKKINFNNIYDKILYIFLSIMDIIGLIGIYGYSFKKLILSKLFWKIFLIPFFLCQAYLIFNSTYGDKLAFIISLIIIMPSVYILYLYIFKENWI